MGFVVAGLVIGGSAAVTAYNSSQSRSESAAAADKANAASLDLAKKGEDLGKLQLAESKRQYDLNSTRADLADAEIRRINAETKAANAPINAAQLGIMDQSSQRGAELNALSKNAFQPVDESIAADAMKFSSADYAEREAGKAIAGVNSAAASATEQRTRAMSSMGINPNSGAALALNKDASLTTAAQAADASMTARKNADEIGWVKKLNASGIGHTVQGEALAANGMALNAGSSVLTNGTNQNNQVLSGIQQNFGNNVSNGNAYTSGIIASNGTRISGDQQYVSTLKGVSDNKTAQSGADSAALGQIIGMGAGAYIGKKA